MKSQNIKFPIVDNNETNSFFKLNYLTKESYSSDLLLLLLTEKGSRYYNPDYGTNLTKFLFEPNDSVTQGDIISEIKQTVSKYIPNLTINNVTFNQNSDDDDYTVSVLIEFTYSEESFSESGSINLNF